MSRSDTRPVEVTTKYATTVEDLPAAWAFIMEHIENVGGDPSIIINPIWQYPAASIAEMMQEPDRDEAMNRVFEVVVSGMVSK